jgi:hypothetical protein
MHTQGAYFGQKIGGKRAENDQRLDVDHVEWRGHSHDWCAARMARMFRATCCGNQKSDEPVSGARIGSQLIGLAVQAQMRRRYGSLSRRQIRVDAAYRIAHCIFGELL